MAERQLATVTPLAPVTTNEWTEARQKYVLENFCGGAPVPVAMAFIELAMRRNLSPEARQIYLIKRRAKDGDKWVDKWMQQTGIDGFRIIAERTGKYAGSDEPAFVWKPGGEELEKASVTVWKLVQGQRCPFTATAYWDEYNANQGQWPKMPRTMLAKCAEALALRKAFPEDLSGLYTDAEMDQADVIDAAHSVRVAQTPPSKAIAAPAKPDDLKRVKAELWEVAKSKGLDADLLNDYAAMTLGEPLANLAPSALADLKAKLAAEDKVDLLMRLTGELPSENPEMFADVPHAIGDGADRYTSR